MPPSTDSRRSPVLRLLLILLPAAAALYAAVLLLAWRFQERVVYQPPPPVEAHGVERSVRRVSYAAADGTPLFAYVIGDPAKSRTVLAFHGNADLAVWELPWAEQLARRAGVAVVLAEYRGYSGLGGPPTYHGIALDAAAARVAAIGLGAQQPTLIYYGHSLGSAVAAELAVSHAPARLVLESPFTSAQDMASRMGVPGLAWVYPAIARVRYATLDRVRALDVPVWVAHGDRDLIVPVRMGRAVFAAAKNRGEMLVVAGGSHNDLADTAGEEYWNWLVRAVGP